METFFEIIKILLPCIGTGIFTFFITYYNCRKSVPLQKYEIAYNRIYYPICCLLRNKENIETIIEKSEFYIKKYDKYVDRSTVIAFRTLNEAKMHGKAKKEIESFENNIFNINSKLRRNLGYLETNLLTRYKYLSSLEKRGFRIFIELIALYFTGIIIQIATNHEYYNVMLTIFIILFFILIIESVISILEILKILKNAKFII